MMFELKCCGKIDPIGVDKQNIRLSFALREGISLRDCTVQLRESANGTLVCALPVDGFTAWVEAECLKELTGYAWCVVATTQQGQTLTSETAYFETGPEHWQGRWISGQTQDNRVLEFQKELHLERLPKKARLYICGLGYFSAKLNGKPLDDAYFIPPVTDYATREVLEKDRTHASQGHRITYYTYDVKDLLQQGSNLLCAEVAGGYFSNQEKLDFEPQPDFSFGEPCLIYELHLEDDSGNVVKIVSGTDDRVRSTHETALLYAGDQIDFTQLLPEFEQAHLSTVPDGTMTSPMCEADKVQRVLTPVASWQTPEGTVYDFGINHSGGLRFTAEAQEDTELVIRYAEVLHKDGSLNFETSAWHGSHNDTGETKDIYQQNTYWLKKGSNVIAPKFGWFCYRYVLVPNTVSVQISQLCSLFIHMNMERDGSFACANPILNRLNDTFLQTLLSNMHSGLLMDCPHRERLPYTGDGKLVMKSACYNLNGVDYYYKWFADILDAQTAEGLIPNSAPYFGGGGGYAWGNALCEVSKQLYCFTGDMTVARRGYEAIVKWLGYYESKRDQDYVIRSNSHTWMLGDWLAPDTVISDVYYISTVCYLQAAKTALFFAKLLDPERCARWQALIDAIIQGINRVFFNEKTCCYANGVQGQNMLALAEGIVPEQYRRRMLEDIRKHYIHDTAYHLDTGVVLTPMLLEYLTENDCWDIAWGIMTADTYPSYYNLMEGDTTFSEHWSKQWPDYYFGEPGNSRLVKGGGELSHCHPMYGSVAAWLYERVAGLDLSCLYQRKLLFKPYFMDSLSWAKASKKTAWGEAGIAWKREGEHCTIELSVPKGLTASCQFPATCKCLKNVQTNQFLYPQKDGWFRFCVEAGESLFISESH